MNTRPRRVKGEVQVCKAPMTILAFDKMQTETVFVREGCEDQRPQSRQPQTAGVAKNDAFAWKLVDIRTGKVSPIEEEISREKLGERTRFVSATGPPRK